MEWSAQTEVLAMKIVENRVTYSATQDSVGPGCIVAQCNHFFAGYQRVRKATCWNNPAISKKAMPRGPGARIMMGGLLSAVLLLCFASVTEGNQRPTARPGGPYNAVVGTIESFSHTRLTNRLVPR
jgi:hypothetical protein